MWVWREDAVRGGWRLDAHGTWMWDEPSILEREGIGVDALRRPREAAVRRERPPRREPWAWRAGDPASGPYPGQDATPIFHALSVDHDRRATLRAVPELDEARIPEPHPGSGPIPTVRGGLAEVPTVPPPPATGASQDSYESPQDEMRRRAERRRRPVEPPEPAGGGRHALRTPEPAGGRHAMR